MGVTLMYMNLLIRWLVSTAAIAITAYILPGVSVDTFTAALIAALVLGIINTLVKPVLLILTLPITLMTLGLFVVVINAALVLLTARIVPGFYVASFWWAILFGAVQAVVSWFLHAMVPGEE